MAETNLRDLFLYIASADSNEPFDEVINTIIQVYSFTSWTNSAIMLPIKKFKADNIYEVYAKALSRKKEQIK